LVEHRRQALQGGQTTGPVVERRWQARLLGGLRVAETGVEVRPVAERLVARLPAPAQGVALADLVRTPIGTEHRHVAADPVGTVRQGGDPRGLVDLDRVPLHPRLVAHRVGQRLRRAPRDDRDHLRGRCGSSVDERLRRPPGTPPAVGSCTAGAGGRPRPAFPSRGTPRTPLSEGAPATPPSTRRLRPPGSLPQRLRLPRQAEGPGQGLRRPSGAGRPPVLHGRAAHGFFW